MSSPSSAPSSLPSSALKEALALGITDGSFNDTAYYLFSRRNASGTVGSARVVYASSWVMKAAADHFYAQLGGDFSVTDEIPKETKEYAYDDDSDIEDVDDMESFQSISADGGGILASPKNLADAGIAAKTKETASDHSSGSATVLTTAEIAKGVKYRVFVPDVAATTWNAMIYYVYTGNITFAPLKSSGLQKRALTKQAHRLASPKSPPLCSPKSAYRLADIIGLPALKNTAEAEIKAQLSESCITGEVFSSFSSQYPQILDAQLDFLFEDAVIARILPRMNENIKAIVQGHMPHAEAALCGLVAKISEVIALGRTVSQEPAESDSSDDDMRVAWFD